MESFRILGELFLLMEGIIITTEIMLHMDVWWDCTRASIFEVMGAILSRRPVFLRMDENMSGSKDLEMESRLRK